MLLSWKTEPYTSISNIQRVEYQHLKPTKAGLLILSQLIPYLEKQRELTAGISEYVLLGQNDKPCKSHRKITEFCWKLCLDELSIRRRPIKQTRHTFACIMLQNGMDKHWIARRMLGHTSVDMLDRVYGSYIPSQPDDDRFDFLNVIKSGE